MAQALGLPKDLIQSPDSWLAPRKRRNLNPIIEEDSDDGPVSPAAADRRARRGNASQLKIEAWLSPASDHFPTPRGMHYLSAPILPSSPSTDSGADSSPTNLSNPWTRGSLATENTEFEDLYDISDPEQDLKEHLKEQDPSSKPSLRRSASIRRMSSHSSRNSLGKKPARPTIVTGSKDAAEAWSAVDGLKMTASPVPPTPSVKLHMSPAQVEFMGKQQALEVPTISAPPSLDGSFSSEQLAAMSAPCTPIMGNEEVTNDEAWTGIHLQPGALAMLQALSRGDDDVHEQQPTPLVEIPIEPMVSRTPEMQQQQPLRLMTSLSAGSSRSVAASPVRHSLADLTRLDIPSPGGFFSGLSPRSRSTWHVMASSPGGLHPPTSTTAEQFYRCPWNAEVAATSELQRSGSPDRFYRSVDLSPALVEHVVNASDSVCEQIPLTRPVIEHKDSNSSEETVKPPNTPHLHDAPTEIVLDHDPSYARKQQKVAMANLDRTELWLLAQRSYLKGVDFLGPSKVDFIGNADGAKAIEETSGFRNEQGTPSRQKMVRFSILSSPVPHPGKSPHNWPLRESAYFRAFQQYVARAQSHDVFVHQLVRFEALQAQRVALRKAHRNQLLGKFQLSVVPQSAKKRLSANVARGDLELADDPERLRADKDSEAASQMAMATWHVAASKFLNGGRLFTAPIAKRLARPFDAMAAKSASAFTRSRILDLGGQPTCDWGWHCALQYPDTKVYTVTTKAIRQLSNSNIRGPPNHRQVAVERLSRLPFGNNHFDLISARELHAIIKSSGKNGEDEWESCLRECMRVLRPGGYLDFAILDSDIINAGPLGLAKSVEFGFSLKTLGYDPQPSSKWLGRLNGAGFEGVRRMWTCLPIGPKQKARHTVPSSLIENSGDGSGKTTVHQMDAMVTGSSDDIASVCGLVGGWSWERWLLRCEMETVGGELRLADTVTTGTAVREAGRCLEGVDAIMEEGRARRAGFRRLSGYATKPGSVRDRRQGGVKRRNHGCKNDVGWSRGLRA